MFLQHTVEQDRAPLVLPHHADLARATTRRSHGGSQADRCDDVHSALDTATYEKGIKVSNAEMKALNITGDRFHPEWNYKITPRQQPP